MKGSKDVIKKVLSSDVNEDNDHQMKDDSQNSGGQSDAEIPNINCIEIVSDSEPEEAESQSSAVTSTKSTKFYAIRSQQESSDSDSDGYQFEYYDSPIDSPEETPVQKRSVVKNVSPQPEKKSSPVKPKSTSLPGIVKQRNTSDVTKISTTPAPAPVISTPTPVTSTPTVKSIEPKSIFTHNITPQSSISNVTPTSSPKINFVIPKQEYLKCRRNNTPLLLTVPTVPGLAGSNQSSSSMIMILPPNLDPSSVSNVVLTPNSTAGPSQINVAGNQTYQMLQNTFTIQQLNQAKQPGKVAGKSPSPRTPFVPNILKMNADKVFEADHSKPASGQVSGARTNGSQSQCTPPCSSLDLNTKESCGPNFCWYITKNRKRDIEGFQFKDRLGFSKAETNNVARCLRGINAAIQTKIQRMNAITENIVTLNRRRGSCSAYKTGRTFNDEQIRLQNERLGVFFNQLAPDVKPSCSNTNTNTNDHSDDGFNDLFYTKKVVILKNNDGSNRRMKNRTKRMRPLNRTLLKVPMKSKDRGSQSQLLKNCRVILKKDPLVEAKINPNLIKTPSISVGNRIGPKRKLKRDLEDPYAKTYNNNKRLKTYDTRYVSNDSKSTQTEPKSNVRIAYREYQKLTKLSHNEIRFIFIVNTIHSIEKLKINASKPLVILDQSNHHFEFDNVNQYNVIFIRDDGEGIPISLLKNLELVHYIKSGSVQVVSRAVLCAYITSKDNDGNKLKAKTESSYTKDKDCASSSRAGAGAGAGSDKDKFASSLDLLRKTSKSYSKKVSFETAKKNILENKKIETTLQNSVPRKPGFKIKIKSKAELNKLPTPAIQAKILSVDVSRKRKVQDENLKILQDLTSPAGNNENAAQIKVIEQPGSSRRENLQEFNKPNILNIQNDDGLEEGLLEFLSESNRECISENTSKKNTVQLDGGLQPKTNEVICIDLEEEISSTDDILSSNKIVDKILNEDNTAEVTHPENPKVTKTDSEDLTLVQTNKQDNGNILKPRHEEVTPVEADQFFNSQDSNQNMSAPEPDDDTTNKMTENVSAEKSPTCEMSDIIQSESCKKVDTLHPVEELTEADASNVTEPKPCEDINPASPPTELTEPVSEGLDTAKPIAELTDPVKIPESDLCESVNVNLTDASEMIPECSEPVDEFTDTLKTTESESSELMNTNASVEELAETAQVTPTSELSEQVDTEMPIEQLSDYANITEVESPEKTNITEPVEEVPADNSDITEPEHCEEVNTAKPIESTAAFNMTEAEFCEQTSTDSVPDTDLSKVSEPERTEQVNTLEVLNSESSSKLIEPESCERMDTVTVSFDKELDESSSKVTELELERCEGENAESTSIIKELDSSSMKVDTITSDDSSAKPKILDPENDTNDPVVESDETLVSDIDDESLEAKLLSPSVVDGTEPISSDEFDWIQSRVDSKEKSDPM